mgnify:CR=1 FL=1
MRSVLIVGGGCLLTLAGMGCARFGRELLRLRDDVRAAWRELQEALAARREIVPYLVAGVPAPAAHDLAEIIGNACDLAAHVTGVREAEQAEARLSGAIQKFWAWVDEAPEARGAESARELRSRLAAAEVRIAVARDIYNLRARALNSRLETGLGWLLVQAGVIARAVPYQP